MRLFSLHRGMFAVLVFYAFLPTIAQGATYTLDVNLTSWHTERWARRELNQHNAGLGVTVDLTPNWSASVGFYRNSYRRTSVYLLADWTPLHLRFGSTGWQLAAGGEAGLATGYRRREMACEPFVATALIRLIAPGGWSLNISAVPNAPGRNAGFIGAQLSLPLPAL